jgi:ubiquinone/menaquinone biosynthesis C-methylase UbiE
MTLEMRVSEYSDVDETSSPQEFVDFLDTRAALDGELDVRRLALDMLDVRAGAHVLDVGCGSGNAVRELAERAGPTGSVVGLDRSAVMISEARKRLSNSGMPVDFLQGDVFNMEFPSQSFDRVRADRVFIHLKKPASALGEMVRVLKDDGRVAICDYDLDTLFIDSRYDDVTLKLRALSSRLLRNPGVGKTLPRLFREAGLVDVECVPKVVRIDWSLAYKLIDDVFRKPGMSFVFRRGRIDAWLRDLIAANEAGHFHAGLSLFTVTGRKPRRS